MSRTPSFSRFKNAMRIALWAKRNGVPTQEALDQVLEERRKFLAQATKLTGAAVLTAGLGPFKHAFAAPRVPNLNVGIVGAGLAGLTCAYELKKAGLKAALYEASSRAGGRCSSLRGFFPGQVAERGGEFIDNLHKTMLGYAKEFGLAIEDVSKASGEVFYYFDGQRYPESQVVNEYRDFVDAMHGDLRAISGDVTADAHSDADVALDRTSLLQYLEGSNSLGKAAGTVAKKAIIEAYEAEYGLDASEQSCLGFLLFIHADKRSKFTPFGVYSDERWHIVEGNDKVAEGILARIPNQIALEHRLVRVAKTSGGAIELTFKVGSKTVVKSHDVVVISIPFTVLRGIELDSSLGLTAEKRLAIDTLGYGTNAKMMVGFAGLPWADLGSNGASYSDLPNHQATWETNPSLATSAHSILTDYASAARGANLDPSKVQLEASRFLNDLNKVYPGALVAATRTQAGAFLAHLAHWPSNPHSLGSYTAYRPGQFTTICGNEGKPSGNLLFAGEHANSFYVWQGFMEGAALSGIDAANAILKA